MLRKLGPLDVHPLGFGTWGLGGAVPGAPLAYGPTKDEESRTALEIATKLGINFFDTSGLYGLGHAEKLLGESLRPPTLIGSKAGYVDAAGNQDFSPDFLENQLRASLSRLGRQRLELFQLHDPPVETLNDSLWNHLYRWRDEGLCQAIGISVRKPQDALFIVSRWQVDSIQLNFSLVDQRAREHGVLDYCANHGVGIIARTPLGFGFLSSEVPSQLPSQDHRNRWNSAQKQKWSDSRALFRSALHAKYAGQDAHLALAFCLAYPQISVAIPGMLTGQQVQENAGCLQHPLDSAQRLALEKVYDQNSFFVSPATSSGN